MTTHQATKQKVEEKIRSLVPELIEQVEGVCNCGVGEPFGAKCNCPMYVNKLHPIQLQHVFTAIRYVEGKDYEILNAPIEKKLLELYNMPDEHSKQSNTYYKFMGEVLGIE